MAFALVQSSGDTIAPIDNFSAAQTINTWTGATNFIVGNLVIVKVTHYAPSVSNSLSCTVNGTAATKLERSASSPNDVNAAIIFYVVVATGSARNVVLTPTAGSGHYMTVDVEEYSFAGTLSLVGSAATGADGTSTGPTANTSSSAASGDLAAGVMCVADDGDRTISNTAPSSATLGFNEGNSNGHEAGAGASKILSAGGAQAFTWSFTTGGAGTWTVQIATFNQTGGGGGDQTISPSGLASAEAHGSHTVTRGSVSVTPSGLTSAEATGSHTLAPGAVSLAPTGLASAEAHGSHTVAPGSVSLSPTGLTSAEAFGSHSVASTQTLTASGLASAGAFGTAQLNLNVNGLIKFAGHCVGDSMIDSPGISGSNLHDQLMALRTHETWTRHVTTGLTVSHFPALISNFATRVQAFFVSGARNVVWVFSVSHGDLQDDGAATASSVFDLAIDFVDLAHSNNWLVGIITVPPTTEYNDPGSSPYRRPKRKDYNNLLRYGDASRARWAGADFFVDLEPVSGMGQDELPNSGNPGGTYWQSDGIHPTAAAITVVRNLIDRALTSVHSKEAVTQPTVAAVQTIAPSGKSSDEVHGSQTVTPGAVIVAPSGLATAEAPGAHVVTPGAVSVACTGLASAEATGTATVTPGAVSIVCSGLATAEGHGSAVVTSGTVVAPTGLASAEATGSHTVAPGLATVACTGLASAEAHGTCALVPGAVTVLPSGLATAEAHGAQTITRGAVTVAPTGLASAEAIGSHVIDLAGQLTIAAQGLASAEAHGSHTLVPGSVSVSPSGLASAGASGTPTITLNLLASAIGSGEAVGNPSLALQLLAQGLVSAEAVGALSVLPGLVSVLPLGLASAEAIGSGLVQLVLAPAGLPSAEAVPGPTLVNALLITPSGIVSLEAFGQHLVLPAGVILQPIGVASGEAFGVPFVDALVFVLAAPERIAVMPRRHRTAVFSQ